MLEQTFFPLAEVMHARSWIRTLVMVVSGSFLIALFAPISFLLPFSPVPISFQPHVCLLLGALLGSRVGSWAVFLFLLQGASGLPVFALGSAGIGIFFGPRGGYLIGYLVATWITGFLVERAGSNNLRRAAVAMAVGNLVIYLCGLSQLSLFVGIERLFLIGMLPFLLGDYIKLFLSHRALKALGFGAVQR